MSQLFIAVLSLSLSGTLTGLMITATHFITEKYFSRKWNYYIWLLVVVQLLLPLHFIADLPGRPNWQISLNQGTSAPTDDRVNLLKQPTDIKTMQPDTSSNIKETQTFDMTDHGSTGISDDNMTDHNNTEFANLVTAAAYLWFFGFLISLFVKLLNYFLFKSRMKKTCGRITDTHVIIMENTFCTQLHIQNAPALYESTAVASPMTIGLLKPRIILPKAFFGQNESAGMASYMTKLQLVLRHELIHVARKDLLYKWLCQLLLCIHWFNPVLYQINRQISRDCELSCDEAILAGLTENGKQLYGNILLDAAAFGIDRRGNALSTTLLENKKDLKKRLDNILHYRKTTRPQLMLSMVTLLIMLALSSCGTVWISADDAPASESRSDDSAYNSSRRSNASSEPESGDSAHDSGSYGSHPSMTAHSNIAKTDTDSFDLSTTALPSLASLHPTDAEPDRADDAKKAYEDDKLLAGDDIQIYMGAYNYYSTGHHEVLASHLYLYGSDTFMIAYAERDINVWIKTSFTLAEGKFKIVSIAPDGSVVTLNETGDESWQTITMKEGRNVIKMIGLEAHLENLLIDYSDLKESDFQKIYYSEGEEYAGQILDATAAGATVSKDKFIDAMIYLDAADTSNVFNALLSSGTAFTGDELYDIFIYSDATLSSQYLLDAVKAGTITLPSAGIISELMPYLEGDCQTELLKSLPVEEFYDVFEENIVYLDNSQIDECLTDYLDRGGTLTYSMYDDISPYLNRGTRQKLDKRLSPALP